MVIFLPTKFFPNSIKIKLVKIFQEPFGSTPVAFFLKSNVCKVMFKSNDVIILSGIGALDHNKI